jgi:hypothetical protein
VARPGLVILCDGRGTRLREHTETIPKRDRMDTYKDAVLLDDLWGEGRAPWKLW